MDTKPAEGKRFMGQRTRDTGKKDYHM